MKGKKDGQQKYRVRINYKDSFGENRQLDRVAYGLENARALERRLEYELRENLPERKMTIQTLYNEFAAAKKYEVRETTLAKSLQILKNHVLPTLSNKKITDITVPVLQKWKQEIEEKELGIVMKKNIFGEFRALMNYAVKMEYIQANPLPKVGNFKDAYETVKNIDYYTSKEFLKFIAVAKKEAERIPNNLYEWNYYVFFNIAFYTGMRKGEINALKWTDIEDNLIHVSRSIAQKLKGEDRETPPKNKSSIRTLQMPKPLKKILDEHYKRYQKAEKFTDDWRICGGIQCLRDTSIDKRNKEFAKKAGIKSIRIHDFRHPYVKLKLKKLFSLYCRLNCAEILHFPYNLNSFIRVNIHFIYEPVSQAL